MSTPQAAPAPPSSKEEPKVKEKSDNIKKGEGSSKGTKEGKPLAEPAHFKTNSGPEMKTQEGMFLTQKNNKKDSKAFGWHSEATQKFVYSDKFIQELILSEKNEIFRPPKMKPRLKVVLPDDIKEKAIKKDLERQTARKKQMEGKKTENK